MSRIVDLTGGPAKDDLLRAVMNPQDAVTTFETPQGAIEASIERLEENGADGVAFLLWGGWPRPSFGAQPSPRTMTPSRGAGA